MPSPPARRRSLLDTRLPIVALCVVLIVLVALLTRSLWERRPSRGDHKAEGRPAPLSIVSAQFDAEDEWVPTLVGDTLIVRVTYDGDCEDHRFGLDDETRGDTLLLRLTHNDAGDTCDGRVYDELRLAAPAAAKTARVLVLEDPEAGTPFPIVRAVQRPATARR